MGPASPSGSSVGQAAAPALGRDRDVLLAALDRLGVAALWLDARGRLLEETTRLRALLADEPERERVFGAAMLLARSVAGSSYAAGKGAARVPDEARANRRISTARGRYTLRAVCLASGEDPARHRVVISLEQRTRSFLPGARELMALHGLTRRESEVALLLAVGASDQEVAQRLTISHHTARKHAEHIFTKLGIHSRKALALELVESKLPPATPARPRAERRSPPPGQEAAVAPNAPAPREAGRPRQTT